MFDHACTIKSKPTPSTPTKNEDNSLADLQSQNLSMKSEIELQKDIIHELEVRLLQRESKIEKLRKQLIADQQFATLEKRKNIRVMTTDELMVHGRHVRDGHYVVKRYCLNILNNKFSLQ
jgi:septal ring factor EnvC (AmiA/AmiB activator)